MGKDGNRQAYRTILGLRAIRSFRPDRLAEEDLDAILEAARWTGSAKNRQSWAFVVIANAEQRLRLAECGDFADPIRRAPLTVALVQEQGGYEFDTGRVAQNMMLAAATRGVASCPVTLHREDDAAQVLGLDGGARCRYAVAMGYPSKEAEPSRLGGRKGRHELVHIHHYDSAG